MRKYSNSALKFWKIPLYHENPEKFKIRWPKIFFTFFLSELELNSAIEALVCFDFPGSEEFGENPVIFIWKCFNWKWCHLHQVFSKNRNFEEPLFQQPGFDRHFFPLRFYISQYFWQELLTNIGYNNFDVFFLPEASNFLVTFLDFFLKR